MPIYEFMCQDCGIKFERLFKRISTADTASPCPECGDASKLLVSEASHTFKHSANQTRGALPPNTGTSDDWNYDKAIGRSAEEGWNAIESRDRKKDDVIRDEARLGRGITRDHLVSTGASPVLEQGNEAGYRAVSENERKSINARRAAAKLAREAMPSMLPGE